MTKEITKAYIIQQIEDRFKLRELIPETFAFSETVIPVYNIEDHLKKWTTRTKTTSVTGTGGFEVFAVPQNERWILSGYTAVFMAVGAYTISGYYITRAESHTLFVYLDLTAGISGSYTVNLPKPLVLDSGDTFNVNVDGYTSTATLRTNTDVVREDVR